MGTKSAWSIGDSYVVSLSHRKYISMNKKGYLFAMLCLLASLGCGSQKLTSRWELQDLIDGSAGHQSSAWMGTYYCGTKGEYHYIAHRMQPGHDTWYIILTNVLVVINPIPLTHDKTKFVDISFLKRFDPVRTIPIPPPPNEVPPEMKPNSEIRLQLGKQP